MKSDCRDGQNFKGISTRHGLSLAPSLVFIIAIFCFDPALAASYDTKCFKTTKRLDLTSNIKDDGYQLCDKKLKDKQWKDWRKLEHNRKPRPEKKFVPTPKINLPISPKFPAPPKARINLSELLTAWVAGLISEANAASANQYGDILVDGDLSDWSQADRLNLPLDLPPYLASGNELYGKFTSSPTPTYLFALRSSTVSLGQDTTLWLNADQNAATGYKIWGSYGGAENFINIYSDGVPHLYNETFNWIGALDFHYSLDQMALEIAVPANLITSLIPPGGIDLLGDINNSEFLFPQDYAMGGQYTLSTSEEILPPRTDFSKRIGIVFGATSQEFFFSPTAYSQLFMSLQHQAMMAGIPFDLLTQEDLTDISKIRNLDALVIPYLPYVPSDIRDQVHDTLYKAIYHYGIGIVSAGNLMTNDETGQAIPGDSYRYMKQLLGLGRIGGDGPATSQVHVVDGSHSATTGYQNNEFVQSLRDIWFSHYDAVEGQPITTLATQTVSGTTQNGVYNGVIATETGSRHVHFAEPDVMANANLAWQAIQWVVYGVDTSVGLKLGRENNLFLARNDMDQAMEQFSLDLIHFPLLDLIIDWKNRFNFVGSYYLTLGNDFASEEWTDWSVSGPLYRDYITLGNEIGTHSRTHPHITDLLSSAEIEFEFNQSMNEITVNLGTTWRDRVFRGGAVPGAAESLTTSQDIIQYLDYLSGRYAGVGAGYPGAFGFQTPDATEVYFSPNMSFDFTLIDWGVPVGYPPVPQPLTADEATIYWMNEYLDNMSHASQPLILWPWHDYGPTIEADPVTGSGYSVAMYEDLIALASTDNSEFVTLADTTERIVAFKDSRISVVHSGSIIDVDVLGNGIGKSALEIYTPPGQVVRKVDNWYAYDDSKIFLDNDGGAYTIHIGDTLDPVTHISKLPMRARLLSLTGDGSNLSFSFEGEGQVRVLLNGSSDNVNVTGAGEVLVYNNQEIGLSFEGFGIHTCDIVLQ